MGVAAAALEQELKSDGAMTKDGMTIDKPGSIDIDFLPKILPQSLPTELMDAKQNTLKRANFSYLT